MNVSLERKKLFSIVLDKEIEKIEITGMNMRYREPRYNDIHILNIYELMYKCKEWLINKCHQCVWSGNGFNKLNEYECSVASFYGGDASVFRANTEQEAIFKACDWMLDNKC